MSKKTEKPIDITISTATIDYVAKFRRVVNKLNEAADVARKEHLYLTEKLIRGLVDDIQKPGPDWSFRPLR